MIKTERSIVMSTKEFVEALLEASEEIKALVAAILTQSQQSDDRDEMRSDT